VQGLYVLTSQVSSVGGYHDEGEEPPHASHHSCRDCPRGVQHNIRELFRAFSSMIFICTTVMKNCKKQHAIEHYKNMQKLVGGFLEHVKHSTQQTNK
jgi:hypothetical protein